MGLGWLSKIQNALVTYSLNCGLVEPLTSSNFAVGGMCKASGWFLHVVLLCELSVPMTVTIR